MASEAELVKQYRAENPKSRANRIIVLAKNTSATKQQKCVLCGWHGPTWAGSYPQTKRAYVAAEVHRAMHLAEKP